MKKLGIGIHNFKMEELEGIAFLKDYKIKSFDAVKYQNMEHLPCLFILRGVKDSMKLWNGIQEIELHNLCVCFLLLIKEEDFSFVYHACKHKNVLVFLEKEGKDVFKNYLWEAVTRLVRLEQVEVGTRQLAEYEYERNRKIMDKLFSYILQKPKEVAVLLPEINQRYGTKLKEHNYEVFVINVNQYEFGGQSSQFHKQVILLALHTLRSAEELIMGFQEPYGMVGILHNKENVRNEIRKKEYKLLWRRIKNLKRTYGEFEITVSVGGMVDDIAQVSQSLEEAAFVREYYLTKGKVILFADEIKGIQQDLEHYIPKKKIKELIRLVSLGEVQQVNNWFTHFYRFVEPTFLKYPPAFTKFCWSVCNSLAQNEKIASISTYPEWKLMTIHHIIDGMDRCKKLEEVLLEICHMIKQENEDDENVAAKAIDYMKAHYMEPLNLDSIAEECGLSTSYFSRKFKEETGENYIDVLTDIRIREAQRLIRTTDLPIGEIVELVGYCDGKHFRRVFQKTTGMRPAEYRKNVKKKN